jgi:N-formylglutamate amidohydrolase
MIPAKQSLPDFEILQPDTQKYSIVFNSPHSGASYRDDFIAASRLKPLALRKSEDAFVDELFGAMPDLGCPLLKANFPRAYLDVNRGPWELDPKMFSDSLPAYAETKTLRVIGGLGTIARNVSEREKIYHNKLKFSEAKARVERYYFPYHQTLTDLLDDTRQLFGQALLIDCHSMPTSATRLLKRRNTNPDIILGDRFGSACDGEMIALLEELFIEQGLKTTRNKPYAGGHITQAYGRPAENQHAIQIEIDRRLYMNEKSITKSDGFETLKQSLTDIFEAFLPVISATLQPASLAAE